MPGWWMAAFAVQWLLLIGLCVVVVALARQVGALHLRLGPLGALEIDDEGPPLGQTPPALRAKAADGRPSTWEARAAAGWWCSSPPPVRCASRSARRSPRRRRRPGWSRRSCPIRGRAGLGGPRRPVPSVVLDPAGWSGPRGP